MVLLLIGFLAEAIGVEHTDQPTQGERPERVEQKRVGSTGLPYQSGEARYVEGNRIGQRAFDYLNGDPYKLQ